VDADEGDAPGLYKYERRFDKEEGLPDELMETDHTEFHHTDYVAKTQWENLYDLVAGTIGEDARVLDGGKENGRDIIRGVDAETGVNEVREMDCRIDFNWNEGSEWVDYGGGSGGGWYSEAEWEDL
jgi:hypothetical protein